MGTKHEYNIYNLFVGEDGKRLVETNGPNALNHPVYLTKIYPWVCGASNDVVFDILTAMDSEFWGTIKTAVKARKAPQRRRR